MSSMFFGHYLLENGVIGREALLDAIEMQRRTNRSLPDIAVREGLLDQTKAEQIHAVFRVSNSSHEDLCISEGKLAANDVERLTRIQSAEWLRIGCALVKGGHLAETELATHLRTFNAIEATEQKTLDGDFNHLEESTIVRAITELTLRHVARMTGVPVKLQRIDPSDGALNHGFRRFAQKIVGDREFFVTVDLGDPLFSIAAKGMLGVEVDPAGDAARDAGCELINLIGGNACTRLEPEGFHLRPEPPFCPEPLQSTEPNGSSIRGRMAAGEDHFEINIFINPP
ncbi:MAG: hypothetical protein KAJ78_01975 [Acidobacteria bacterium]|nr:hypothetical protein [Acidobacteriota bacterium]